MHVGEKSIERHHKFFLVHLKQTKIIILLLTRGGISSAIICISRRKELLDVIFKIHTMKMDWKEFPACFSKAILTPSGLLIVLWTKIRLKKKHIWRETKKSTFFFIYIYIAQKSRVKGLMISYKKYVEERTAVMTSLQKAVPVDAPLKDMNSMGMVEGRKWS